MNLTEFQLQVQLRFQGAYVDKGQYCDICQYNEVDIHPF